MSPRKILGVLLLTAGVLALVYGRLSYTKERHEVKLGPIELQANEKETVEIPTGAGVALIVGGGLVLVAGKR